MGTELVKQDEREQNFVQAFVETGNASQSALAAGYSKNTAQEARRALLTRPSILHSIQVAVRKRMIASAPMAQRVIEELAKNEDIAPRVRLDAARTLLDRAGHVAPRIAEKPSEAPLHELSTDALKQLASRLEGELAGRAKPVISATAAPNKTQDFDI